MEKSAVKDGIYSLLDSSKSVAYNTSLIFLRYGIGGAEMIFHNGAMVTPGDFDMTQETSKQKLCELKMRKMIENVKEYEKQGGFDGEKTTQIIDPVPVPLKSTNRNERFSLIVGGLYKELKNGEKKVVDSYLSKLVKRKGLTREDVL